MLNIDKQIVYWRDSSLEDWQVANELIHADRLRYGLFFAQLALENILKALICQETKDLAPRIHNLARLSEFAALELTLQQIDILAEMNAFNIEGRYPDALLPLPSREEANSIIKCAEEVYRWLMSRLL
jgi:HEPN domain-containing protein